MDEGTRSAGAVATGLAAWVPRQPRKGIGAGAIFCATAASFVTDALGLWVIHSGPHQLLASPRFWIIWLVVIFPALALFNSVGVCAGVCLWVAPEAANLSFCGRAGLVLGRTAPAASLLAAADAALMGLRVFFPPLVLGGGPLPLWGTATFKVLGWISAILGVPFAWWLWRTIHAVVRVRLPGWQQASAALSWLWPAQLAGGLVVGGLQAFPMPPAGADLSSSAVLFLRVSAGLLALIQATSVVIDVASLALLLALQARYWANWVGTRKGDIHQFG